MFSPFEYKGIWHVPENKEIALTGHLSFDGSNRPILEVIGSFYSNQDLFSQKNKDLNVIWGNTVDGKKITLFKCFNDNSYINTQAVTASFSYKSSMAVIGGHFKNENEIKYSEVYVEFNLLEDWLGENCFNFKPSKGGGVIEINKLCPTEFQITKEYKGRFETIWSMNSSKKRGHGMKLSQSSTLAIIAEREKTIFEFRGVIFHFQRFLAFATGENIYAREIKVGSIGDVIANSGKRITVVFPIEVFKAPPDGKLGLLMPFSYDKINHRFENIISKWYSTRELLEPVFNLFFDVQYRRYRFNENRFLNTIQAVETFHRRTKKNRVLEKLEYKEKVQKILDAVNPEDSKWLKEKLMFGNEPSLHQRLESLIDEYSTPLCSKLIGDKISFIKRIKWSRNYYTHYDSSNEKKTLKNGELFLENEKLKILLKICLLKEIGFDDKMVDEFLKRDDSLKIIALNKKKQKV